MSTKQLSYITLVTIHVFLGIVIFIAPALAKLYAVLIPIFGFFYVLKTTNRNNEVLLICAYVVGVEVFLRMTGGNALHELSKYEVIFFLIMGMFYSSFSKYSYIYGIFLLLLVPGIIKGANELSFLVNVRKAIAFNISGPVCLGVAAIYCYLRPVTLQFFNKLFVFLGLPLISMAVYLFLYTPNVKDIITGTQSNFETSGGFGPNQVSTALGLGIFVFFSLMLLYSKSKKVMLLNILLTVVMAFRGIVTFSRGGVITGVAMVVLLIGIVYYNAGQKIRSKLAVIILVTFLGGLGVWLYSSYQTNGMIENRYANRDARGRLKEDRLGGREKISGTEIQMFLDNPIWGVGVGKNKEFREEMLGVKASTHNEITRMLADHGLFGVLCLTILFLTPTTLMFGNRQHIYLLSFFFFWLLTINHAAMRIAAPAFIYALSLLKVVPDEEPAVHRE